MDKNTRDLPSAPSGRPDPDVKTTVLTTTIMLSFLICMLPSLGAEVGIGPMDNMSGSTSISDEAPSGTLAVNDTDVKTKEHEGLGGHGSGRGSGQRLAGRILGFIGLVLLILLIPLGGTVDSMRKRMNKAFGKAGRRIKFHCNVSYVLFLVSIVHAALLMYGHYRSYIWNGVFLIAEGDAWSINIGTVALLLMVVMSLQGMFRRPMAKHLGYKNWRRLHGLVTWATLTLLIVHLLMIGTTIGLPFRTALGL